MKFFKYTVQKSLVFLIGGYFILRIINLTILPIFNDEAIYLDWAWRETHEPGYLFYSLYDGKQPLLMWLFGIAQVLFSDPLFAGRIVAVIGGACTLWGIYKLSSLLFSHFVGILASCFYIITPLFFFYDRQALMESSVGAVGIWSLYFWLHALKTKSRKYAVYTGIILGIGVFIKSSSIVFCGALFLLTVLVIWQRKHDMFTAGRLWLWGIAGMITTDALLFIQPMFWETLPLTARYALTIQEIVRLPVTTWLTNIRVNAEIIFWHITPGFVLLSMVGIWYWRKMKPSQKLLVAFFFIGLFIQVITVRYVHERYVVSFLPILVILAAYGLSMLFLINKRLGYGMLLVAISFPSVLVFYQVTQPIHYFKTMQLFTNHTVIEEYVYGQTSGYGVLEAINFVKKSHPQENIIIGVGMQTGNPESGVIVYLHKNTNVRVSYFDSTLFGQGLTGIDCLTYTQPFYFFSRDDQLVGMEKYLEKVTTVNKQFSKPTIGIYTLRKSCKGESMELNVQKT